MRRSQAPHQFDFFGAAVTLSAGTIGGMQIELPSFGNNNLTQDATETGTFTEAPPEARLHVV
jgi:hypothetical protein